MGEHYGAVRAAPRELRPYSSQERVETAREDAPVQPRGLRVPGERKAGQCQHDEDHRRGGRMAACPQGFRESGLYSGSAARPLQQHGCGERLESHQVRPDAHRVLRASGHQASVVCRGAGSAEGEQPFPASEQDGDGKLPRCALVHRRNESEPLFQVLG